MRTPLRSLALALALALPLAACSGAQPIEVDDLPRSVHALKDFRLNSAQRDAAVTTGIVIAADAEADSFHVGYTSLFKGHQPVYITADAILHALHSSFDHILTDIETASLTKALPTLLNELRDGLKKSTQGSPEARADLDLYLAVAAGLESGKPVNPVAGARPEAIAHLVKLGEEAAGPTEIQLFGEPMLIELAMLKPRGHYTRSVELQRYFRAMMWLGRTEIRIARKPPDADWIVNRKALDAAGILGRSFSPKAEAAFKKIDEATRGFIGPADSMSFPGLTRALLSLSGSGASPVDLSTKSDADIVRAFVPESEQKISSQLLIPGQHPIAFLPLGQRYVFDSHVFEEVTYGKLEQKRMMPSPLDVGWAVFKNPVALDLLKPELDTYKYRGSLDTITKRGQEMGPELWKSSLLHLWLDALRELSKNDDRDADLPAVMKTSAWGRRMLNTQLASWAELRHDTLLYAKQSFTGMALCEYPDAYVEPYPSFFAAMDELATKVTATVNGLDFGPDNALKSRITAYFAKLAEVSTKLKAMAELERRKEPLKPEHIDFINHAVSIDGRSAGCTTVLEPGGWYADLYYDRSDVLWHKPIVADVHTQPTDENGTMVGKVLHVGTGKPRLLSVTIDTCTGPITYRGFVSSYFEKITGDFQRLTDEEWQAEIQKATPPDVPWIADIAKR